MRSSKMFKSVASLVLVMAMVAPTVAATPSSTAKAAKKMSFNASSVLLTTGSTKSVKIKNATKGAKFSWKSSSKKVATVKANAKKKGTATVKAVKAGTAKITCVVKKGKKKSTVNGLTIKVRQKVTACAMQDSTSKAMTSASLRPGETLVLKAAINNNAAGSTTNQTVKWTSSNAKVAKVKKKNTNQATVTAMGEGEATITAVVAPNSKTDKKTITCTIKVAGKPVPTATPKATEKPKETAAPTQTPGIVYNQKYEVTRWYNEGTNQGHAYDGYKNNSFAIWMVGFFDNQYSTKEDDLMAYGPDLTRYRGIPLTMTGQFMYEGTAQKTILLQVNYTKPVDYPIMWKWEAGASKAANEYAKGLSISGINGSEAAGPDEWHDVKVTFTVPKDAVNGDKDEATGKNFGIYTYFPNKPGGALAYVKSNTFHFKNFKITYDHKKYTPAPEEKE